MKRARSWVAGGMVLAAAVWPGAGSALAAELAGEAETPAVAGQTVTGQNSTLPLVAVGFGLLLAVGGVSAYLFFRNPGEDVDDDEEGYDEELDDEDELDVEPDRAEAGGEAGDRQ